ncbi:MULTISPECIES: competence type IV pilus ATPase ComGA [Bacillus]|uniref:competence type IV pilus ATPase ComGA n=1 Tax=Bacillus TaxID=1386 RepID=UPI000BB94740|nr:MULTISPECIES: competence type IV pilus ATPase ComGA [Bacillus]
MNIEKQCEQLIQTAFQLKVSDIHIVPMEHDAKISFRMDHQLYNQKRIPLPVYERIITHLKFKAAMDIGEQRKPQNGHMTLKVNDTIVNLRLSTLPTIYNESLVIRILPHDKVSPLKNLSLFPTTTKRLLSLLSHSHGLILFTGPTGSGKTTTVYSLLEASKQLFQRNIISLEDPVERRSEDVLQVQVNEKAGITYSSGLKAILRHDPDVILVGEIRDEETARIAIRAALTGHLVLSTLHARNTKGAIHRLLELKVPIEELQQTLIAVSAQRLVELKCLFCEQECTALCRKYRKKRMATVFELLNGRKLNDVFENIKGYGDQVSIYTIKDEIKKGIALGYLQPKELERWGLVEK